MLFIVGTFLHYNAREKNVWDFKLEMYFQLISSLNPIFFLATEKYNSLKVLIQNQGYV